MLKRVKQTKHTQCIMLAEHVLGRVGCMRLHPYFERVERGVSSYSHMGLPLDFKYGGC